MPKKVFCGRCIHYDPKSQLVDMGELNVSGKPVLYREWLNCCNEGHNSEDYCCPHYEPNEVTRIRNGKFEQEIKQLQLLGNINA